MSLKVRVMAHKAITQHCTAIGFWKSPALFLEVSSILKAFFRSFLAAFFYSVFCLAFKISLFVQSINSLRHDSGQIIKRNKQSIAAVQTRREEKQNIPAVHNHGSISRIMLSDTSSEWKNCSRKVRHTVVWPWYKMKLCDWSLLSVFWSSLQSKEEHNSFSSNIGVILLVNLRYKGE